MPKMAFGIFAPPVAAVLIVSGMLTILRNSHQNQGWKPNPERLKGTWVLLRDDKPAPAECFVFGPEDGSWAPHPVDGACLQEWAKQHQRRGETVRQAMDREYHKTYRKELDQTLKRCEQLLGL